MRADAAPVLRRDLADVRAVCSALGLGEQPRDRQHQAGGLTVRCPRHGGVSCSVTLGADRSIRVRCFGCDLSGDAFTLIAAVHGLDVKRQFREVLTIAAEIAGRYDLLDELRGCATPRPRSRPARPAPVAIEAAPALDADVYDAIAQMLAELCTPDAEMREHLGRAVHDRDGRDALSDRDIFADAEAVGIFCLPDARGQRMLTAVLAEAFGAEAVQAAGLGKLGGHWTDHRLVIPWRDRDGRVSCLQRRVVSGSPPRKYIFPAGFSPREPFGAEMFEPTLAAWGDVPVVVTEGALDALARRRLARLTGERVVVLAAPSVTTCRPEWAAFTSSRDVRIAFDGDVEGDAGAERFAHACCGRARSVVRERPVGKDWNAVLMTSLEVAA